MHSFALLATAFALGGPSLASPAPVFVPEDVNDTLTTDTASTTKSAEDYSSFPLIIFADNPKWDGHAYDENHDVGKEAAEYLCPEEVEPTRACLGMYVEKEKYIKGFDKRLRKCMREHTLACNKWNARDLFCQNDRQLDHISITKGGRGDPNDYDLKVKFDGKGHSKYWWNLVVLGSEVEDGSEEMEHEMEDGVEKRQLFVPLIDEAAASEVNTALNLLEQIKRCIPEDEEMTLEDVTDMLRSILNERDR